MRELYYDVINYVWSYRGYIKEIIEWSALIGFGLIMFMFMLVTI